MLKFNNVTMHYIRGEWELEVRQKHTTHAHVAKSDYKVFREYHGILHRALPAVRRYLDDPKDIEKYKNLYKMIKLSCQIFKKAGQYPFTEKIEYTVPCLAGHHHVRTNRNHGCVRLTQMILTDHRLSKGGYTTLTSDPGNHLQACDIMMSTDAGEIFQKKPEISFNEYMNYLEGRVYAIHTALSNPHPADYGKEEDEAESATEE